MARFCIQADWDDAPHLTQEQKAALWESIPPYQRNARARGIPQLGSGAIYPVAEDDYLVDPFEIPPWFRRGYGMDVGWNRTAVVWGAHDPESDILYLTGEYYRSQAEPPIHATAIKARGEWMKGVIDPASRGRSQIDGRQLMQVYKEMGLLLFDADNSVEAGLYAVWTRLSTGRLKVFRTMPNWLSEARVYRRDEKGKIVKENDHLMDATRYFVMSGLTYASIDPGAIEKALGGKPQMQSEYKPYGEKAVAASTRSEYSPYG